MSLENWVKNSWLEQRDSDAAEIARLLALADGRLEDYQRAVAGKLSSDVQLGLAYDAIRISATAALRSAGYRVVRGGNEHYRTIEALEFSIDPQKKLIPTLDKLRRKRNIGSYDDYGLVSQGEADHCGKMAVRVRKEVEDWTKTTQIRPPETWGGINTRQKTILESWHKVLWNFIKREWFSLFLWSGLGVLAAESVDLLLQDHSFQRYLLSNYKATVLDWVRPANAAVARARHQRATAIWFCTKTKLKSQIPS